jgi:maleate isomerase
LAIVEIVEPGIGVGLEDPRIAGGTPVRVLAAAVKVERGSLTLALAILRAGCSKSRRALDRVPKASIGSSTTHAPRKAHPMIRHFGVLIPSTNTTVEMECRLLPSNYQAHIGRLMTSRPGQTFASPRDDDLDYQSRLLGTAKVEMVILAQTSASVFVENYDEDVTRRMSAGAGCPSITSAQAIGRAVRALGARRIGLVSPYSEAVNRKAADLFARQHGIETVALEGFGATDSYAIGHLGPENARDAFARIDRPEIEVLVVPGGNFPTMASIAGWEREFNKPVITTNQASFWAMLTMLQTGDRVPGYGRLLAEAPGG